VLETGVKIDLNGRVAIVTGAARGLGRAHAELLAGYGARVVINDLPGSGAADTAFAIEQVGGQAMAIEASVTDPQAIETLVATVRQCWGPVDILVCNAAVLRDRTMAKMTIEEFDTVIDVSVRGAFTCVKAVWNDMRDQNYGRIVFTTSSSGLYGNFGQANYGAAKMALVGLMQSLSLEGERYGIRVNCLAPSAATDMTDSLYPPTALALLPASAVSPAVAVLACSESPNRTILLAGAGHFAQAHITMTEGLQLGCGDQIADSLLERLQEVGDRCGDVVPLDGATQHLMEVRSALALSAPV